MTREDVLQEFGWDTEETYDSLSGDLADEILFLRKQLSAEPFVNEKALENYAYEKSQWEREDTLNSYEATMMLKPFLEQVEHYQKEVGCTSNGINSHNLQSSVNIKMFNPKTGDTVWGKVKWIEPMMLGGCGCWCGIKIITELDD